MKRTAHKILVVGGGSIGTRHLKNLRALGFNSLSVSDPDAHRLADLKREMSVPVYTNVSIAFEKERPSVALICAPTSLHLPLTHIALDSKCHVFIEKPLSHTPSGIDELIKRTRRAKRTVMVACNFLFDKGYQSLERTIRAKTFGKPLYARIAGGYYLPNARPKMPYKKVYAATRSGGGVILDSGCHSAYYSQALFGKILRAVALKSSLHPLGIQCEEIAHILFEYEKGVTAAVSLDYISKKPMHRVEVVTEEGMLTWNFKEDTVVFECEGTRKVVHRGQGDANAMYLDELQHYFSCIEKGEKPLQNLAAAGEIVKILYPLTL